MGAFKGVYVSTESAATLDVNRLVTIIKDAVKALLEKKGGFERVDPVEVHKAVEVQLQNFQLEGQSFEFIAIPNRLGGFRWLAKCPKCGKRVLKLYKPTHENREPHYFCKDCHNLRSPSALYGPTRRYKEVIKPMRRMERIKEMLAKGGSMSENRTRILLDEYETLEKSLQNSTFHRKLKILGKDNEDPL